MTRIDVNDMRSQVIALHNLKNVDSMYTFYYDETNNIRKFYLKHGGFNVSENANFVLGGVMHDGEKSNADLAFLFKNLNLQKTIKEVKLKHIASGDFINCLKAEKLHVFLRWLHDSDLYIHYSNVNILYYSIVDIIDSIIVNSAIVEHTSLEFVNYLKNELYKLVILEKGTFLELLYTFEYPNIKKEKISDFINCLMIIISKYDRLEEFHVGLISIKQLLKQSLKSGDLCFIMNEEDHILLKDFSSFYLGPIYLFKNSKHIFDEEVDIQRILDDIELYDGDLKIKPHEFIPSENSQLIQVSDIIVGLIGKYFSFLNYATFEDIENLKAHLSSVQRENLKLFMKLIDKSDMKNRALLLSVTSNEDKFKNNLLLKLSL